MATPPPGSGGMRAQVLRFVTEMLLVLEGEPVELLIVSILGILRDHKTRLRFESTLGEPATLIGWGARLETDELSVLRILAAADEGMQSAEIARQLGIEEGNSTLRGWLAPGSPLRAGGYITWERGEGYSVTPKGRNAVESAGDG